MNRKRGVVDMNKTFAVYRSTCADILKMDPESARKMVRHLALLVQLAVAGSCCW